MKSDKGIDRRNEEESDYDDGNSCVYYVNKGGDAHLPRDLSTEEFSQRRTTEFMRLVDEDTEDEEDVEDTRPGREAAGVIEVAEEETVEEEVEEVSTTVPSGTTEEETGTQPSQEEQDHEDTGDVRDTKEESQPAVRRSVRDRRPPKKFDAYVMKVTPRPIDIRTDYRIHALTELVNSRVLQNFDSLIAQRIVDSVMK